MHSEPSRPEHNNDGNKYNSMLLNACHVQVGGMWDLYIKVIPGAHGHITVSEESHIL